MSKNAGRKDVFCVLNMYSIMSRNFGESIWLCKGVSIQAGVYPFPVLSI